MSAASPLAATRTSSSIVKVVRIVCSFGLGIGRQTYTPPVLSSIGAKAGMVEILQLICAASLSDDAELGSFYHWAYLISFSSKLHNAIVGQRS